MSADLAFLDTNVLVYAFQQGAPQHKASRHLLDEAQAGNQPLCISPQVLSEFYSVVTDPRRVTAPRQSAEALDAIEQVLLMSGMTLLPTPVDLVMRWIALVRQHAVTGGGIFDVQLVATMLANGVTRIYTFDQAHFTPFSQIQVLTPS